MIQEVRVILSSMIGSRPVLALFAVIALSGCSVSFDGQPPPDPTPAHGVSVPSGAPLQMAVQYKVTFYCPADKAIGDGFWRFDHPSPWPPEIPSTVMMAPHAVPGTFTLISETTGAFQADVDGSVLTMTKVTDPVPAYCL